MDPSRGDSRYNLNYSMSSIGITLADQADMYGNPTAVSTLSGRPPSTGLLQGIGSVGSSNAHASRSNLLSSGAQCQPITNSSVTHNSSQLQRGIKRSVSDCYDDSHHRVPNTSVGGISSLQSLDNCGSNNSANMQHAGQIHQQPHSSGANSDVVDESYNAISGKKSPPANGKKTKGRVKIKMEYIDNKLRRYTTFSKRKTGIMKKAYELSTLTGTQVMLLVASETGHVYTFATRKLQPMITSEAGKQLIQTCLNSPDPPSAGGGDQRMSATGFEETELSYNIADEDSKEIRSQVSSGNDSDDSSDFDGGLSNSNMNLKKSEGDTYIKSSNTFSHGSENTQFKEEKTLGLLETESHRNVTGDNLNAENSNCTSSAISNVSQDVLLQLIKTGHLEVHTEEDGSGHQYVAIPLSPTSMNLLQSTRSVKKINCQESNTPQKSDNGKSKSETFIKEELES